MSVGIDYFSKSGGDVEVASDLVAKVAYLQGLSKGMGLSKDSKEGKLIKEMISIMKDFAEEIRDLQESQDQLKEYTETLDDALSDLEDEINTPYFYDDEDDDFVEVECPNCGELVIFEADILEDDGEIEVICPECEEVVFLTGDELDYGDDEEDESELEIDKESEKVKVD